MAGIPSEIVTNASKILKQLEALRGNKSNTKVLNQENDMQLSFFQLEDPILEQIRDDINNLDINGLTPLEALMKLNEIKKLLGK
jgi:DNA mismatch repair protein MutS